MSNGGTNFKNPFHRTRIGQVLERPMRVVTSSESTYGVLAVLESLLCFIMGLFMLENGLLRQFVLSETTHF